MNPKYLEIVAREFSAASGLAIGPEHVDFNFDEETITVSTPDGAAYVMQLGSDDDGFYFMEIDGPGEIDFPFPADWIDLEENES